MNSLTITTSTKPLPMAVLHASKLISRHIPALMLKNKHVLEHQHVRNFSYSSPILDMSPERQLLSDKINKYYPKIINNLETWIKNVGRSNILEIYDKNLIGQGLHPGKNTYLGGMCCQMTSHLMARELENENFDIKLYRNDFSEYPFNHFYLTIVGNEIQKPLIVDASYRQFFRAENTSYSEEYNRFLYEENQPFMVGSRDDLVDFVNSLKTKKSINFIDIIPKTIYWDENNAEDVTHQLKKLRPVMEKFTKK
jgi:hypothetical protein